MALCDVPYCGGLATFDRGRHVRMVGMPVEVRYLCERHAPKKPHLTLDQAARNLVADFVRQGRQFKRGQVARYAHKYELDLTGLLSAVDARLEAEAHHV